MDVPQVRDFEHVKLGYTMGMLAIIEKSSGEPVDFVSAEHASPIRLERLCAQWDAYFSLRCVKRERF